MPTDEQIAKEYNAFKSKDGEAIVARCQEFIEENCSKLEPLELRGMVRLLRHIKAVGDDYRELREKIK
jgi:hypothetical protein